MTDTDRLAALLRDHIDIEPTLPTYWDDLAARLDAAGVTLAPQPDTASLPCPIHADLCGPRCTGRSDPVRPPETDEEPPKDFGQQIMLKGWLPRELRDDDYVDEPNPAWLGAVLLVAAFVAGLVSGALLWGWPRG